ncbi:MAG: undecaprenyl/decaprenyl-phosphate alpha-N-acetylglucosaminyl 1-phosphate transferase [Anaerolineae bacterium]|nr:undecaprenyl/decaprenyl-phosphate alpha-N-acetylglucosaminyl 1-phosphate transferase [Anaerolineae bacterium]
MTTIMLIFTMALFFGSVGTPLARKAAIKSGFIAAPKADRAHQEPTALMGGLAIYAAAIIALLIIIFISALIGNVFRLGEFASIIIAASLMAALGLWDDRKALPPWLKLIAQLIPAVIVFMAGVRVSSLPVPATAFWGNMIRFVVTLAWILYITNALNFLDNADGIAAMTSATTSASFLLIAVLNGQQLVSVLAAAVLGASLGFARYNLPLPKSTIFMGDSGSLFLGFLLAVLGIKIRIPGNAPEITWMVPIIVLALPIFDTALVYISRTRRGQSFFKGGVDHSTHRLSRYGLDKLSVALAVSLINGALGLVAIFVTQASKSEAYVVGISLVGLALYALWQLEFKASFWFRTGKEPVQLNPVSAEGKS